MLCFEYINDHGAYSAPLFYRGFPNLAVHQPIMLFVMEFHQKILKEGDNANVM